MHTAPSPAIVASQVSKKVLRHDVGRIHAELIRNHPKLRRYAEDLGLDIRVEIDEWVENSSPEHVADWIDKTTSGYQLASRWKEALSYPSYPALFPCLVQDDILSARISDIGPHLKAFGQPVLTTIYKSRERLSNAAFFRAQRKGWLKPIVFARTHELAWRGYEFCIAAAADTGATVSSVILARQGIAIVSAARVQAISIELLQRAAEALSNALQSHYSGAGAYYIEACLRSYDASGNREFLVQATRTMKAAQDAETSPALSLNIAEVWLKLAAFASPSARSQFISRAFSALTVSKQLSGSSHDEARQKMMVALAEVMSGWQGHLLKDLQGVRFPFGLRVGRRSVHDTYVHAGDALVNSISSEADEGDYLYRDVAAQILSYMGRFGADESASVGLLKRSVGYRRGRAGQTPLSMEHSQLEYALDCLEIARLDSDRSWRVEGLLKLAHIAATRPGDATALTAIAVDVETNGAHLGALLPIDPDIAMSIRNGQARALFSIAAERALRTNDTSRVMMGGRGSTVVIQDVAGILGETYVFKTTTPLCIERDRYRSRELMAAIDAWGVNDRFGVIEHLSVLPADPDEDGVPRQVSVRRFMAGTTLRDVVSESREERALVLLENTATFLGRIHTLPVIADASSTRRAMLVKELGRWLKFVCPNPELRTKLFNAWWNAVKELPLVPRRDAHLMNWLVDDDDRISAVDLESVGCRPVGYELAQLSDDFPVLPLADWNSRERLLTSYMGGLSDSGATIPIETLRRGYVLGLLARAVRGMSDPESDLESRKRGGDLLSLIRELELAPDMNEVLDDLSRLWTSKLGTVAANALDRVGDATRRRISRAMAFELRHNRAAAINRAGWMHVEELVSALRTSHHRVTQDQLLLIAGALGEPRFELDGLEIRARYGHSNPVDIAYELKTPPEILYHATPLANLATIVEAQSGLVSGKRQWVHLSDDSTAALGASRRHGTSTILLRVDTSAVPNLVHAAHSTWLAVAVPLSAISIVPAHSVLVRDGAGASDET